MKDKGFTLVEIMVASFVMTLVLASMYVIYLTGLAYFKSGCKEFYIQNEARLSADRLVIGHRIEGAAIGIVDGIRFGRSAEIFDDIDDGTANPQPAEGDYIKVYFPTAAAIGPRGYYLSDGKILSTMGTDTTDDDIVIVDNVVKILGVDVFSQDAGGLISIDFKVEDDYDDDGYQGIGISTQFYQRN